MAETDKSRFKYSTSLRPGGGRKLPYDFPRLMKSVDYTTKAGFESLRTSYTNNLCYYNREDEAQTKAKRRQYVADVTTAIGLDDGSSYIPGANQELELNIFNARKMNLLIDMINCVRAAVIDRVDYCIKDVLLKFLYSHGNNLIRGQVSAHYNVYSSTALNSRVELEKDLKYWFYSTEGQINPITINRNCFIGSTPFTVDGVIITPDGAERQCILDFSNKVPSSSLGASEFNAQTFLAWTNVPGTYRFTYVGGDWIYNTSGAAVSLTTLGVSFIDRVIKNGTSIVVTVPTGAATATAKLNIFILDELTKCDIQFRDNENSCLSNCPWALQVDTLRYDEKANSIRIKNIGRYGNAATETLGLQIDSIVFSRNK